MKRRLNILIMMLALMVVGVSVKAAAVAEPSAKKDKREKVKAEQKKEKEEVSTHVQKLGWLDRRYLFGVATSYADSVTMVTMVAPVDSMAYDENTRTPLGLDLYTDSYRNFLDGHGFKGYLCSTFIFSSEKKAERKLAAVCRKVKKRKGVRLVSADGFEYRRIATEHIYTNVGEDMKTVDDR
ncbi:MAG: hypothetical protein J1F13_02895 [Prevotellaceae bacterium]|nr:hypothetical protein [Prevotellaceae bacterium]